ncbi:MATE family efflux transporter [Anaeromassilibacillus senegalensis]|uniref:MATE family efflux transporter n=1 Tax=Anaeromassilibacillus senegalensis TaxID=1673717 RepID=A0ABS9CN44_9FIRM|nr:MATE family efflux transporter [Anaeromassilibacillus senegalensis]MCF2652484.1 MATE family efflux transporter [Anaeromassilibacillus senegalensis]
MRNQGRIQLSDHFTYGRLLRFTLPSIVMMIFTSIYSVVDGLFVSNFVGKTPFAAINLIMPILIVLGALGFMIGTGGSAIVAKTLGERDTERANHYFSMLVYVTVVGGVLLTALGELLLRPMCVLLGAKGEMLENCVLYGRIVLLALTAFMLQNVFQSFLITAEKARLGLIITVLSGVTNMVLDYVFIALLHWGLAGAALATALSQMVGGVTPFVYFLRENDSLLRLTKTRFDGRILLKTCTNGSSELMSNVSASVVTMLYNFQLMSLAGEDGIAAYGVVMYVNFIFAAIFVGYSIGTAPVIGYQYGAQNHAELKNLFRRSLVLMTLSGAGMALLAEALAQPLTQIFVGYDAGLYAMTLRGFRLYSVSFLITGINIFGSSFFTALNNGVVSAAISFLRTLVFQVVVVLVLPAIFGLDGIWFAITAAELLALAVTILFFVLKRKEYHYA